MAIELTKILWYVMCATGVCTWTSGAWLLWTYLRVTDDLGSTLDPYGESTLPTNDGDGPTTGSEKTVEQLFDDAINARASLDYINRQLCQRAGLNPWGLSNANDMISAAVYDGRNVRECEDMLHELEHQND